MPPEGKIMNRFLKAKGGRVDRGLAPRAHEDPHMSHFAQLPSQAQAESQVGLKDTALIYRVQFRGGVCSR